MQRTRLIGVVVGALWLGACADDVTSPTVAPRVVPPETSVANVQPTSGTTVVRPSTLKGACQTVSVPVACYSLFPTGWLFYNDENDAGDPSLGSFVAGPASPPLGTGSVQISVTGSERRNIATYQFAGAALASITTLKFTTYNPSAGNGGSSSRSAYLQFNVDFDGSDTWQRRISYVPANNGTVVPDTWKEWDAINGGNALWGHSGPTWPGTSIPGTTLRTWSDIVTSYPGVRIRVTDGFLGFRVGEPYNDGYTENIDSFVFGTSTFDFEPETPCTTTCYADATNGNDANGGDTPASAKKTIQAAINAVSAGGQVRVLPGAYSETAAGSMTTSLPAPPGGYQFGLFFPSAKKGISLIGVTAADAPITSAASTLATITTNATNSFGYSGIFVEADSTTIQGVTVGPNAAGDNKTIEVVADAFTLQYVTTAIPGGGAVYLSEFDAPAGPVLSYRILNNAFTDGTQVAISSGAGQAGPVADRQITGNTFDLDGGNWPGISFNGSGGVPWYTKPVGGAIITGNSFTGGTLQYIRARGTYTEAEFDWSSFWTANTYDKGTVALVTEAPFDVRSFSYVSAPYTFTNVRRIGATIQGEVGNSAAGDVVRAKAGTYSESVVLSHGLTLKGATKTTTILQGTGGAGNGIAFAGALANTSIQNLTVQGFNVGIQMISGALTNILVQDVASLNNTTHGILAGGNSGINGLAFTRVTASGNNSVGGLAGRGLYITDGIKANISITGGRYDNNGLVGIDVNDGNVTGLLIAQDTVSGNGDSGIGVLGAQGPGANTVTDNVVTNNGRFGIEIKVPTGSGAPSGAGSIVVSNNVVTRTVAATDARDYAGIAVFKRSGNPTYNAAEPTGVVVTGNTVNGYVRKPTGSTGDGFGIVVEGTGHSVSKNIVSGNDVGIQIQMGNTANTQSTPYFDRGDASTAGALINRNSITGNLDFALRNVGAPLTNAQCNWFGSAAGPAPGSVSGSFDTTQWLTSSNLNGGCSNQAPIVNIGGPYSGNEGSSIAFSGTASDPEGASMTYDWDFGDGQHASTLSASHTYVDNGNYAISLTVSDGTNTTVVNGTVSVANLAPVPSAGPDVTVIKNTALVYVPSFTDAGLNDANWVYTVEWGDGSPIVGRTATTQGTQPSLSKTYSTPGTYTRRIIVTDKDGASSSDVAIITVVNNTPPVAVINGPYTGVEGTGVKFSSAGSNDPDGNPITYSWKFGDGGTSAGVNPTRIYTDNGTYTVTLIVKDNKGGADTATTTATISNVNPTAVFAAPTTVTEGQTATLALNSATDKGAADRPTLQFAFDCGTGGGFSTPSAATSFVCPALPDQRPARTLRAQVIDKDGGTTTYSKNSSVTNAAPVVTFTPVSATTITAGGTVTVTGSFTDKGVNDFNWTYTINWGDGKPNTTGTVGAQGALSNFNHIYTATGTFLPKLTIKDKDGKSTVSAPITITVTP